MGPRKPDIEKKRGQIFDAAFHVFAEHGFQKARIEDVASLAGVAKGSIYHYFRSKEQLFLELSEFILYRVLDEISAMCEQGYPAMVDGALEMFEKEEKFFLLMMEFWSYGSHDTMRSMFEDMYERLRNEIGHLILREQAAGHFPNDIRAEDLAAGVIAVVDGFFVQNQFSPKCNVRKRAKAYLMYNYD